MIRKYTFNANWKPMSRHHQYHRAFKNGLYGFKGGAGGWKVAKVRFLRRSRSNPFSYNTGYSFGGR